MRHAVIMAGGSGKRLWPLSRSHRPKQLMRLFEGRSLLRLAWERLAPVVPPDRTWVITVAAHLDAVARELPELPRDNLIGEPEGRDTANAIALAACLLATRDPEGTMGVFTADHIIRPLDTFAHAVNRAFHAAEDHPDALVTFGVRPAHPHTGLGYIHRGQPVSDGLWQVRAFKEKPDLETARRYVASGEYFWNSGMFAWRIPRILDELRAHLPESLNALLPLARTWNDPASRQQLARVYPTLPRISIDYAVMEKAHRILMVELDCQWLDVGSWPALRDILGTDAAGNTLAAPNTVIQDAHGNIVAAEDDHLIALLGVEDLIVVRSESATLVCRRDCDQQIKALVERIEKEKGSRFT